MITAWHDDITGRVSQQCCMCCSHFSLLCTTLTSWVKQKILTHTKVNTAWYSIVPWYSRFELIWTSVSSMYFDTWIHWTTFILTWIVNSHCCVMEMISNGDMEIYLYTLLLWWLDSWETQQSMKSIVEAAVLSAANFWQLSWGGQDLRLLDWGQNNVNTLLSTWPADHRRRHSTPELMCSLIRSILSVLCSKSLKQFVNDCWRVDHDVA